MMHPIERLRWVARAPEGDVSAVTVEAAGALAGFADDPAGLVIACRRLIERRPASGPLWWLASRVLCALDPVLEAELAAEDLYRDPTVGALAEALPGGKVVVSGWPEQAGEALRRRRAGRPEASGASAVAADRNGGVDGVVVVADPFGQGRRWARRLARHGLAVEVVDPPAADAAVRGAALVLLEAHAVGPGRSVCPSGSAGLAAAGAGAGTPVWLVAGVGRVLPGPLFDALVARLGEPAGGPDAGVRAGGLPVDVVALDAVDEVATPAGLVPPRVAVTRSRCPVASELVGFGAG